MSTLRHPLANVVLHALRQLLIAKNRLWFDYWRPQNWAFLAGDRTAQPSSRAGTRIAGEALAGVRHADGRSFFCKRFFRCCT